MHKQCSGYYDDGADGNTTACNIEIGCFLEGCPGLAGVEFLRDLLQKRRAIQEEIADLQRKEMRLAKAGKEYEASIMKQLDKMGIAQRNLILWLLDQLDKQAQKTSSKDVLP